MARGDGDRRREKERGGCVVPRMDMSHLSRTPAAAAVCKVSTYALMQRALHGHLRHPINALPTYYTIPEGAYLTEQSVRFRDPGFRRSLAVVVDTVVYCFQLRTLRCCFFEVAILCLVTYLRTARFSEVRKEVREPLRVGVGIRVGVSRSCERVSAMVVRDYRAPRKLAPMATLRGPRPAPHRAGRSIHLARMTENRTSRHLVRSAKPTSHEHQTR